MKYQLLIPCGEHVWIIRFTPDQRGAALRLLGRWASDPALSFTWYDAAVGSQKIRAQSVRLNRLAIKA